MKKEVTSNVEGFPTLIAGTFKHENRKLLKVITMSCINNGIVGFDTAPSYRTEKILGSVLHECINELGKERKDLFIGTKIDAWQMQDSNGNVGHYVDTVLKEMNLEYIDQLMIHWPIPEYFVRTWESFIDIYKLGKAKIIGVCNVRERHLLHLMDCQILPMAVQNERHPLRNDHQTLEFCKKNHIAYQAYSPVGQMKEQIRNSNILQKISHKYNKSVGQVIMRWHIDTGSIPVFMTTKPERIKEYSEIFNFSLTEEDIDSISSLDINYKIFLESVGCPGF